MKGLVANWSLVGVLLATLPGCAAVVPTEQDMLAHWRENRRAYIASLGRVRASLTDNVKVAANLAKDGVARVDRNGRLTVVYLVKSWGLDESWGIVHLAPETPIPDSDPVLEKWHSVTRLEPCWYLVRGT